MEILSADAVTAPSVVDDEQESDQWYKECIFISLLVCPAGNWGQDRSADDSHDYKAGAKFNLVSKIFDG